MLSSPDLPSPTHGLRRAAARRRGFTLIEVMISLAVLSISTMGGIAAFLTLNRYAANLRNQSEARALCQERIEQAQTMAFRPILPSIAMPAAPNADPTTNGTNATLPILGLAAVSPATTDYNVNTGAYTSGTGHQTSSENIPIYTQSDGTSAKGSANVTYTRTTTVSPTTLTYAAKNTSLNLVLFTVTVSYVFHGQTYSTSMSTLRSPD